jgi:dipeptide transport system substrate-binding protein
MTVNRPTLRSALALAALLACGAAASAKTLVYCAEGSPENFTPALNTTGTSFDAAKPVYDHLTQFARGTTQVEPGLAESWTVSPDSKVFTFKLRKGVKFHSGVNGFTPRGTSTPTTWSGASSASGSPITPTPRCPAASTTTSPTWA